MDPQATAVYAVAALGVSGLVIGPERLQAVRPAFAGTDVAVGVTLVGTECGAGAVAKVVPAP